MPLVWTRVRDGEHNGKPTYEYHACAHDRAYHIVWSYDGGFGYTARDKTGYIHGNFTITWPRALWRCKEACQKIEDSYVARQPAV
jgi:hypothetical protein